MIQNHKLILASWGIENREELVFLAYSLPFLSFFLLSFPFFPFLSFLTFRRKRQDCPQNTHYSLSVCFELFADFWNARQSTLTWAESTAPPLLERRPFPLPATLSEGIGRLPTGCVDSVERTATAESSAVESGETTPLLLFCSAAPPASDWERGLSLRERSPPLFFASVRPSLFLYSARGYICRKNLRANGVWYFFDCQ